MPQPLPDPLGLGPFRLADAVALGVGRHRLRRRDVAHPHHGVYAPVGTAGLRERCRAVLPLLGPYRGFSHVTAARLWQIPLPWSEAADEDLHVLALPGAEPMRRPGIVGWESEGVGIGRTLVGDLPVVAPADVWCQLAVPWGRASESGTDVPRKRSLSRDWLVAIGDHLLTGPRVGGRRHPLCTPDELTAALRRHRGKRGAKDLRAALPLLRAPVHSPRETLLRLALVAHGLPEPEVQMPVLTADGVRHADLGYPEARLLIEYQGDHHRTDRAQWLEDLRRGQLFQDAGYRAMFVGANEFEDGCAALAQRIRRALRVS